MKLGSRQLVIILIMSLIIATLPILRIPNASGDLIDPSALIQHDPISISGNSGFTSLNGVVGGAGTKNNPYIIENWSINISVNNNDGIIIQNTDAYFVIRNCEIFQGRNRTNYGIALRYVKNGVIKNNRVWYNWQGIYIRNSDNNTIENNTFLTSYHEGISLSYSNDIIIRNNVCNLNGDNGIYITRDSKSTIIINNTCKWNGGYGISTSRDATIKVCNNNICEKNERGGILYDGSNCIISNNNCSSNGGPGIYINGDNNIITNSICINNSCGILLYLSNLNKIINNICNSNSGLYKYYHSSGGIFLEYSDNNTILNNTCNFNYGWDYHWDGQGGISLYKSNNNIIKNNICKRNLGNDYYYYDWSGGGISLIYSNNNSLKNNICNSNNQTGISIWYSDNNIISNNTCNSNSGWDYYDYYYYWHYYSIPGGISIAYSKNNTIVDNNCNNNNESGIALWSSANNKVLNNKCNKNKGWRWNYWYYDYWDYYPYYSGGGVSISCSENNTIAKNICNSNNESGINIWYSDNNSISKNICNSNNENGINIWHSDNNSISKNICSFNKGDNNWPYYWEYPYYYYYWYHDGDGGINLGFSNNNSITENNCYGNNESGIYVWRDSKHNLISNNTCTANNYSDIHLNQSSNNILVENYCNSNNTGIQLSYSDNNILRDNTMELCGIMINGFLRKHWNTHTIDTKNTVNNRSVYYWKNQNNGTVPIDAGEVILAKCKNVIVKDQQYLNNGSAGILLGFTSNSIIKNTTCNSNNFYGTYLFRSENNKLSNQTSALNKYYGNYIDTSANNIFDNGSIISNKKFDFYLENNSLNNIAINSTFDSLNFNKSTSELKIKNFLHIQVNDSYNFPVRGADVIIKNNKKPIYSTAGFGGKDPKTNALGQCKWILVTDRIYQGNITAFENGTSKMYKGFVEVVEKNTTASVKYKNKIKLDNSREVNMSTSHFEYFDLDLIFLPKKVTLHSPMDNSIINNSTPELKWLASEDGVGNLLTYYVQIDELDGDWKSIRAFNHTALNEITWNISTPLPDEKYQWRVCANNVYGNGSWSDVWMFTIDATSPASEIYSPENNGYYNQLNIISGNATDFTNCTGINKVEIAIKRLSDNYYWNSKNWTSEEQWLTVSGTKAWSYDTNKIQWITDEFFTIRTRALDNASNLEIPGPGITFMYDNKPPEISILINNDIKFTNSTTVVLSLNAVDTGSGVWQMGFSNYGMTWTDWELYNITKPYIVTQGDGRKSVFFKVRDRANNSAFIDDSIILDSTPPYALTIFINDDVTETNSTEVILKLSARDVLSGVFMMSFSIDGENWSNWESFADERSFTLPPNHGDNTIYYRVKDLVGNIAEPVSRSIFLNITSPTEEKETPDKSYTKTEYWFIFIIIMIITIILVIVIFIGKRKKRQRHKLAIKEAITIKPTPTPKLEKVPEALENSPALKLVQGKDTSSTTTVLSIPQQLSVTSADAPSTSTPPQIGQTPTIAQIPQAQPTLQLPPGQPQAPEKPPDSKIEDKEDQISVTPSLITPTPTLAPKATVEDPSQTPSDKDTTSEEDQ